VVSGFGGSCEKNYSVANDQFNSVRCRSTGLLLDIPSDFEEIDRSLGR